MTTPNGRSSDSQAFWTLAVGTPVVLSVMRLWVEAGGELQTTLLLVANVNQINLIAALLTTTGWFAATVIVAVLSAGGILLASSRDEPSPFLIARWAANAPMWLKFGGFLLAGLSWKILYLPLLFLAFCAAFQFRMLRRGVGRVVAALAAYVGYGVLLWPTMRAAWVSDEWLVLALLAFPPLLALAITGPVLSRAVRPVAWITQVACLVLLALAAMSFVKAPVLPLTVVTTEANGEPTPRNIRGNVIVVDDVHTIVLQEGGGVQYIPNGQISSQSLCPNEEELPRYRLWMHGFHIEDSLLRALGRTTRPATQVSPECRLAPSEPAL